MLLVRTGCRVAGTGAGRRTLVAGERLLTTAPVLAQLGRSDRRSSVCSPPTRMVSLQATADQETQQGGLGEDVVEVDVGVDLPPAQHTRVKTAEFVKSSVQLGQCPREDVQCPEFAVIGRSNVGKSSLINMLTGVKNLAMISKTPGKTTCINHFHINKDLGKRGAWYLVDLPGYGYAQRAKKDRLEWNAFTRDYFLDRKTLAHVLLLVDASIPPTPIDLDCADWLANSEVPFAIVFTKIDKRKKKCPSPQANMDAFKAEMLKDWEHLPPVLTTSSTTGAGKGDLLNYIAQLREFFKANH